MEYFYYQGAGEQPPPSTWNSDPIFWKIIQFGFNLLDPNSFQGKPLINLFIPPPDKPEFSSEDKVQKPWK